MTEFKKTTYYRAKNRYTCVECNVTIAAGENYQRVVSSKTGKIRTDRYCLSCVDLSYELFANTVPVGVKDELLSYSLSLIDEGDAELEAFVTDNQQLLGAGRNAFFDVVQDAIDQSCRTPELYWLEYWGITDKTSPSWSTAIWNSIHKVGQRVWWCHNNDLVLCRTNLPAFVTPNRDLAAISVDIFPEGPVSLLSIMPEDAL